MLLLNWNFFTNLSRFLLSKDSQFHCFLSLLNNVAVPKCPVTLEYMKTCYSVDNTIHLDRI
jgi:hypothetical protein